MTPSDNRETQRHTTAQRLVTALRVVLTWPSRIARALVTLGSWYGAFHIGRRALDVHPMDKTILLIGIGVFLFGTAFAWPDIVVRTFSVLANAFDAVRARKVNTP